VTPTADVVTALVTFLVMGAGIGWLIAALRQ
jgi:hypothetical protein